MQDFVRLHMMSILQPFAMRVQELQGQIQELAGSVCQARDTADSHTSSLEQHENRLASLDAGGAHTSERLEKVRVDLASVRKESNRRDGNHEMTKASLGTTRERLETMTSSLEVLQQSVQDSAAQVGSLEQRLVESEKRILQEHLDVRLDKQGKACSDLNEKMAKTLKACEQAKALGEKANLAIEKLTSSQDLQAQVDEDSLSSLRFFAVGLENKLNDLDGIVKKHTDCIKPLDNDVQHLMTRMEQLAEVRQLSEQQSEAALAIAAQAKRLDKAEGDLLQMKDDMISERELQSADRRNLEERIDKAIPNDLAQRRDNQRDQLGLLMSAVQRLDDLESDRETLAGRADTAEQEIRGLSSWQRGAARELQNHQAALDATRVELQRAQGGVEAAGAGVLSLRGELGTEREQLAKLGSRLDQCYKYFSGLGKGLQDTRRQIVSGDSGLLPPLPNPGPLPALPAPAAPTASAPRASTPRSVPQAPATPRVCQPSPRRVRPAACQ